MQGELIDNDGAVFAGTISSETAVFSRRTELRQLRSRLRRLETDLTNEQSRFETLVATVTDASDELAERESVAKERRDELSRLQGELAERNNTREQLLLQQENVLAEFTRLLTTSDEISLTVSETELQLQENSSRIESLRARIAELEIEISRGEEELRGGVEERTERKLKVTRHEARLTSLRQDAERLRKDLEQRSLQRTEAGRRLAEAELRNSQLTRNLLNARAVLAEQHLDVDHHEKEAIGILQGKQQLRDERKGIAGEDSRIRKERRELSERHHKIQMSLGDLRHQMDALKERIEEEYQLSLAEVVADGTSAIADWKRAPHGIAAGTPTRAARHTSQRYNHRH